MKHIEREEMRALLTVAFADNPRNWLMILVSYLHGLRASEVCGQTGVERKLKGKKIKTIYPLRGIDIRDGELTIQRLKGSRRTVQPLVSADDILFNEKSALEALAATNPGILFPITRQQFWNIWQVYGKQAGLKKRLSHPHTAKHSIITHAVQAGVTVDLLKEHAGHESLTSTGAYIHADAAKASYAIGKAIGL